MRVKCRHIKLYKSTYEHTEVSQFMLHSHNVHTEGFLEGTKSSGGGGGGGGDVGSML